MEYAASFSTIKFGKAYIVDVRNLRRDKRSIPFQVDSGASMSLIGLNTICGKNEEKAKILKEIVVSEIQSASVNRYLQRPKTITNEEVIVYPCKCGGISVCGTLPVTLYFHFFLGDITLPLLGFDFLDDCSYHHSIGGDLLISAMAKDIGKRFYPDNVLDFNDILDRYESEIARARA